ncbi:MAG: MgtC/SapB family protein [Armatimonadota bacterium]
MNAPESVMILRLALAAVLGGAVGWERERHHRPAGLRTHMLVCIGSALITLVSQSYGGPHSDPARIAAQIVTGIGFLGAGTIIRVRDSNIIRGLTTAASLWTVAGIGMAVGRGGSMYSVAVATTIIVLLVLTALDWFEHRWIARLQYRRLTIGYAPGPERETQLLAALRGHDVEVFALWRSSGDDDGAVVVFDIRIPAGTTLGSVETKLLAFEWVRRLSWE